MNFIRLEGETPACGGPVWLLLVPGGRWDSEAPLGHGEREAVGPFGVVTALRVGAFLFLSERIVAAY